MMMTVLQVAAGGAIGSVLRYLAGQAAGFAYGTLAVNVTGSFLIGCLWVGLSQRTGLHPFLITGVLGGFTTFSAFSLDTLRLVEEGRLVPAGLYVMATVVLSLVACGAGLWVTRGITT
jgi:CrcB protein